MPIFYLYFPEKSIQILYSEKIILNYEKGYDEKIIAFGFDYCIGKISIFTSSSSLETATNA